eukprot:2936800-Amphidinium_carterae.1
MYTDADDRCWKPSDRMVRLFRQLRLNCELTGSWCWRCAEFTERSSKDVILNLLRRGKWDTG